MGRTPFVLRNLLPSLINVRSMLSGCSEEIWHSVIRGYSRLVEMDHLAEGIGFGRPRDRQELISEPESHAPQGLVKP